jgi:hypothetical protein
MTSAGFDQIFKLIAVMSVHLTSRNERLLFLVYYRSSELGTAGRHTVVSDCLDVQARFVPTNGLLGSELLVGAVHPFN